MKYKKTEKQDKRLNENTAADVHYIKQPQFH